MVAGSTPVRCELKPGAAPRRCLACTRAGDNKENVPGQKQPQQVAAAAAQGSADAVPGAAVATIPNLSFIAPRYAWCWCWPLGPCVGCITAALTLNGGGMYHSSNLCCA